MNDLEVKNFDAFLTGRDIDYINIFYNELLHFISRPIRDFNVPFIRFISLMIEDALVTDAYLALNQVYSDAPVPELSSKMFHATILSTEVPLTPIMMHWVSIGQAKLLQGSAGSQSVSSDSSQAT